MAIVHAEQADARRYASAELDEAQERLAQAQRATGMQEMLRAERFANEALVSAKLAIARTEAAKAEEINRDMTRLSDALIQEIERTGDPK